MKVLFVCHISNRYGANRSLLELARALTLLDVTPVFVVPKEDAFCNDLRKENFSFGEAPISWWVEPVPALIRYRLSEDFTPGSLPEELLSFAKQHSPSIIHSNSVVTPDGFLLAKALAIPHVWHLRELCKEHYQFRYTLGEEFVKECLLASQHCIANSHATAKAYGLSSAPNTSVIYNPVSLPEYALEPTAPTPSDTLRLLSIGHMSEAKGHLDAIQATHSLLESGHNVRLTIVGGGDGTYRESCEKEVQQRCLSPSVSFIRSVENPWELLGSSDLFLQCSQHEAFGRVTVEAMLARCPVLGRNSGGTPEIIEDGQTGFLFNDSRELSDKILSVLKREDLEEITNRAFTAATTRFSPSKIAEEVLAIYNTLC